MCSISGNGFNPAPGRIEESRVEEESPEALMSAAGAAVKRAFGGFFPPPPVKICVILLILVFFGAVWFWLSPARAGLGGSASQYGIIYR